MATNSRPRKGHRLRKGAFVIVTSMFLCTSVFVAASVAGGPATTSDVAEGNDNSSLQMSATLTPEQEKDARDIALSDDRVRSFLGDLPYTVEDAAPLTFTGDSVVGASLQLVLSNGATRDVSAVRWVDMSWDSTSTSSRPYVTREYIFTAQNVPGLRVLISFNDAAVITITPTSFSLPPEKASVTPQNPGGTTSGIKVLRSDWVPGSSSAGGDVWFDSTD